MNHGGRGFESAATAAQSEGTGDPAAPAFMPLCATGHCNEAKKADQVLGWHAVRTNWIDQEGSFAALLMAASTRTIGAYDQET